MSDTRDDIERFGMTEDDRRRFDITLPPLEQVRDEAEDGFNLKGNAQ